MSGLETASCDGLLTPIYQHLNGDGVTELLINKPQEIWVETTNGIKRFDVELFNKVYLRRLFTFIANENAQVLSSDKPFLSGTLRSGERVQLVIPNAATNYTLSIRKPHIKRLTMNDFNDSGFFKKTRAFAFNEAHDSEQESTLLDVYKKGLWPEFIKLAIEFKKNIIISGGTSSGKTTFLNACTSLIPCDERLITLEDTQEVSLPHPNQVNLIAPKNGHIDMQELVQATLRLRPDRIIMGEIRGKEVLDFISACSTGHDGSIATIHANNPKSAFMRMIQLYKQNNVPSMTDIDIKREIESVVDVVIQLKRTDGQRIASQIWYKNAKKT